MQRVKLCRLCPAPVLLSKLVGFVCTPSLLSAYEAKPYNGKARSQLHNQPQVHTLKSGSCP